MTLYTYVLISNRNADSSNTARVIYRTNKKAAQVNICNVLLSATRIYGYYVKKKKLYRFRI